MANEFKFQDETVYIFQVDNGRVLNYIVYPSGSQIHQFNEFDRPIPIKGLKCLLDNSKLPNIRTQRMTHHYIDRDVIIRTVLFEFILINTRKSSQFINSYDDMKACGKFIDGVYHYQEWIE
jgi:hypothetical protein